MTEYTTEMILSMHAERLDAIERSGPFNAAVRAKADAERFEGERDFKRRLAELERKAARRAQRASGGFTPAGHQTTPARVTMTFTTLRTKD